jgi:hypothetical protein
MARGYNATLDVKCWKEHTCCYCAAPYRYLVQKRQLGHGASQAEAVGNAKTAAVRALRGELPMMPCPACGNYQPDMIGAGRLRRQLWLLPYIGTVFFGLLVLGAWDLLPGALALWLMIVCAAVAAVAATIIGAANPNGSLRANKARAARLVEQKRLQPVAAAEDRDDRPRPIVIETGFGYWAVSGLLFLTLILMPGAELVRRASGWPTNPGWHPPMIGPGDTAWTWIEPKEPFDSLRGEWRATGAGKIVNAPNDPNLNIKDGKLDVRVTSREASWSDRIRGPGDPRAPVHLWVRVHIPDNPGLARRTVKLELALEVFVPDTDEQKQNVIEKHRTEPVSVELRLASYKAGFLYGFFWYIAAIGGGAMFLLGAGFHLLRDVALKRCGLPTRVSALSDEEAEQCAAEKKTEQAAQPREQTEA